MNNYIRFIKSFPKSYRLAKKCKGANCMTAFEFHIWRWYIMEIRDKYDSINKQ